MSSPLPKLPPSPLGELPENPLGAPPAPPVIGKREPLRLPIGRLRSHGGGRVGSGSPLPSLHRPRPTPQPTAPIVTRKTTPAPQAPIIVQAPPRAPRATTPIVPGTPAQGAQGRPARRTAAQARDEHRAALRTLYGPQIADHPLLGHADIRERLNRANAAHARGILARAHDAALASAQADAAQAQRENPGYKPPDARAHPDEPAGGMDPAIKARRAAQFATMRETLDAMKGGQP